MKVRAAPGPTGSLTANALRPAAIRDDAGAMPLRIGGADPVRDVLAGHGSILADPGCPGIARGESPPSRSERLDALRAGLTGADGGPERCALPAAPPRARTLARVDAAL